MKASGLLLCHPIVLIDIAPITNNTPPQL